MSRNSLAPPRALFLAVLGLSVLVAGCASEARAGELRPSEPLAVAAPSANMAESGAPTAAESASPSARRGEEPRRDPSITGVMRVEVSAHRSDEIAGALRTYLKKTPGAELISFYVVTDDSTNSKVGAVVGYEGKTVNLSVAITTEAGQVKVSGAYALAGNS